MGRSRSDGEDYPLLIEQGWYRDSPDIPDDGKSRALESYWTRFRRPSVASSLDV